jgi:hypothetical protein
MSKIPRLPDGAAVAYVRDVPAGQLPLARLAALQVARARCPVDTQRLLTSIGSRTDAAGRSVMLYATAPYAGFVNGGTRHMAARRFLDDAVAAAAERVGGTAEPMAAPVGADRRREQRTRALARALARGGSGGG